MKFLSLLLVSIFTLSASQTFAATDASVSRRQITPPSTVSVYTNPVDPIWVDPDYPNAGNITYNFDALKLSEYVANSKPSIMKVKCDGKDILKALGVTNTKIVSVGVQEGDFTYSYDFNNCSFWANKTKFIQATDAITDADALKMAKDFVAKNESLTFFKKFLGEPVITYRNNYDYSGIMREGKSYSTTIIFPIRINGKVVYQSYGEPLGLSLEVNNKGINSMNAQILPFTLLKADSSKLDATGLLSFLKRGGNNPYYSYNMNDDTTVQVNGLSYENIYVFTQKYPLYGGNPSLYITSGIRIKTDKQIDNGPGQDKKDYTMIASDYQIGNAQVYPIGH